MTKAITISSGHAKFVSGARSIVDEVEQARKITDAIAKALQGTMQVNVFHDNTSKTQTENINTIVKYHNSTQRTADYSIHLNSAAGVTPEDKGIEVLCYSDKERPHAQQLADAISKATGLKNRGVKLRPELGFLRGTNKEAYLIESYFVNSQADVKKMDEVSEIETFANAVADAIATYNGLTLRQKPQTTKPEEKPMTQGNTLTTTAKADLKALLKEMHAEQIFTTDHSARIETMTDGEALGLLISVVQRTRK